MYKISSTPVDKPSEIKVYLEQANTYEEAILLLNKFKDTYSQSGNHVSKIENDSFSCIDNFTKTERTFRIEK